MLDALVVPEEALAELPPRLVMQGASFFALSDEIEASENTTRPNKLADVDEQPGFYKAYPNSSASRDFPRFETYLLLGSLVGGIIVDAIASNTGTVEERATLLKLEHRAATLAPSLEGLRTTSAASIEVPWLSTINIDRDSTAPDVQTIQQIEGARAVASVKFDCLVSQWLDDTKWTSSPGRISRHPAFGQIVAMGPWATSFILEKLQAGDLRLHWLLALVDLTGGNKADDENRGRIAAMADDWIRWGQQAGYIS